MTAIRTIAVFGGGFDPIHIAHEAILATLEEYPEIEKTLLIPYHQSPLDKSMHTSVEHRLSMTMLVAEQYQNVFVDDSEAKKKGSSYTIDTLRLLRKNNPDHALLLVLSTESFAYFKKWKEWRTIHQIANIAVFERQAFKPDVSVMAPYRYGQVNQLWQKPCGEVAKIVAKIPQVSSTMIRFAIQNNHPFTHWLNPKVRAYVEFHDLYRGLQK